MSTDIPIEHQQPRMTCRRVHPQKQKPPEDSGDFYMLLYIF